MSSIIIPSSEADRKRIKDAMQEISNSFLRQEAERDGAGAGSGVDPSPGRPRHWPRHRWRQQP